MIVAVANGGDQAGNSCRQWFAIYVKPRHEKAVSSRLCGKGVENFVPLYKRKGPKAPEVPLFPNYVFSRLNLEARLPVLSVPGVFFIVGNGKTPLPIHDSEIARVRAIVESGYPARPWAYVDAGERVSVEDGPLPRSRGCI